MIYHLYWSKCMKCGEVHKWPVYEPFGYMMMRNPNDMRDCRITLTPLDDTTFECYGKLAQEYEKEIVIKNPKLKLGSEALNAGQHVYAMICDKIDGISYRFGSPNALPVRCPYCGDQRIPNWGPTEDPYETADLAIPEITHQNFDDLREREKRQLVYAETLRALEYYHDIRTIHEPVREGETFAEWLIRSGDTNYARDHLLQPLMDFNVESL